MKTFFTFSVMLLMTVSLFAQDKEEEKPSIFDVKADLMSRYIWRGCDLGGESPSIQPSLVVSLGDSVHAFSFSAWAAYNFNTATQEVDLSASYTFKDFLTVNVYDYYFPGNPAYTSAQKRYFEYEQDNTGHLFEGSISFNGTEKIPFTLLFAMNFYGMDSYKIKDDGTTGGIVMSKYIELGYKKTIRNVDFNAFIGAALDDPDEDIGEQGYYYNKSAGIINIGVKVVKEVKITDSFNLPLQASFVVNPEAEKVYLVFGMSF